jgi:LCP family protein required for cell wall assembly
MSAPTSAARAFGRRLAIALGVSALVMVVSVIAVNWVIERQLDKIEDVDVATAAAPPEGANYLVIGSDTREFVENAGQEEAFGNADEVSGQRSDTMMVVHVEPGAKRTLVVSFPRDLWVDIPGEGMAKINAAFTVGPDKVIETLKANFGVEINHYIEVNFKSFEDIVEVIGSVPTYFPYPARDMNTNLLVGAGCVRLDGPQGLAYVRSRSLEYLNTETQEWFAADSVGDINRIARQQEFIRAMAGIAVAKSLDDPLAAWEITQDVVPKLKADAAFSEDTSRLFEIVDAFRSVNPDDTSALNMQTFPWVAGPPTPDGQSVLYPDDPAWREMARRLGEFGGVTTTRGIAPSKVELRVLAATGSEDIARSALDELVKKIGFQRGGTGEVDEAVPLTEVRYARGAQDAAKLLATYVLPRARLVLDPSLKGADVELVIGNDFQSILLPASLTTTTTSTAGAAVTSTTAPTEIAPVADDGLTPAPIANESALGDPAPKLPPC